MENEKLKIMSKLDRPVILEQFNCYIQSRELTAAFYLACSVTVKEYWGFISFLTGYKSPPSNFMSRR